MNTCTRTHTLSVRLRIQQSLIGLQKQATARDSPPQVSDLHEFAALSGPDQSVAFNYRPSREPTKTQ